MSSLVFPSLSGLDIDIQRSPIYSTEVQQSSNGLELRAAFWSYPRYKISLSFNFLRSASYWKTSQNEWETLVGFLARMAANYDTFYFEMPDDYFVGTLASPTSTTSMPIGVGNGTTTAFQLQRTLVPSGSLPASASRSYFPTIGDGYEPIFVVNNTTPPSIFVNTTLKTAGTHYNISSSGLVTFTSGNIPTAGQIISWTGSYYWNVRLEKEQYDFQRMLNGVWEAKTINLITVKS
jgi:uncharacterized protein (TIGR02217 family)